MIKVEITKQMEMVLYHSEQSDVTVNAIIKDETIWITQKAMAELFGIDKSGISRHLSNIFKSGELDEKVVVAKIATTTQFRIWITNHNKCVKKGAKSWINSYYTPNTA